MPVSTLMVGVGLTRAIEIQRPAIHAPICSALLPGALGTSLTSVAVLLIPHVPLLPTTLGTTHYKMAVSVPRMHVHADDAITAGGQDSRVKVRRDTLERTVEHLRVGNRFAQTARTSRVPTSLRPSVVMISSPGSCSTWRSRSARNDWMWSISLRQGTMTVVDGTTPGGRCCPELLLPDVDSWCTSTTPSRTAPVPGTTPPQADLRYSGRPECHNRIAWPTHSPRS